VTTAGSTEGKSAQGALTVTATVVSSVGILIGPDGEQVLVVANPPAATDNMSVLTAASAATALPKNSESIEKRAKK
jgi:hypothetical protein